MQLLTDNDKEIKTLSGLPLYIDQIPIYPIKIRDIAEQGEHKYNLSLMFTVSLREAFKHIAEDIDIKKFEKLTDFELILILSTIYEDFCEQIIDAINFFIKVDKIQLNKSQECFDLYNQEDKIGVFNNSNYDDFINIIKIQNYIKKEEEEYAPANKKAAEMIKRKKELQKKMAKAKGQKEILSFADYISILMAKSHEMDVNKCLDMTLYAFFNYLERLTVIDNYEIGIQQLLAGAKPNQVNLKHWLTNL